MSIGDYLNLDMVRIYEEFFYINSIVAEEVFCLLLSGSHLSFEVLRGIYSPDTSSAAACRSLNEYGISAFFGNFLSLCKRLYSSLRARYNGNSRSSHGLLCGSLVAEHLDRLV